MMVEVTHGPCLIDNNVMLSGRNINLAQGSAFVHNLIVGNMRHEAVTKRQTPYHYPHSTKVLGIAPIFSGDDRFLNNIIINKESDHPQYSSISNSYSQNLIEEEYETVSKKGNYSAEDPAKLPVWIEDNVVTDESEITSLHKNATLAPDFSAQIKEKDGRFYLKLNVPENVAKKRCLMVNTSRLGAPVYTEELYENPDGSPIEISYDILGEKRNEILAGPLAVLKAGEQEIVVW
jgi:hypothetical protein